MLQNRTNNQTTASATTSHPDPKDTVLLLFWNNDADMVFGIHPHIVIGKSQNFFILLSVKIIAVIQIGKQISKPFLLINSSRFIFIFPDKKQLTVIFFRKSIPSKTCLSNTIFRILSNNSESTSPSFFLLRFHTIPRFPFYIFSPDFSKHQNIRLSPRPSVFLLKYCLFYKKG